MVNYRIDDIIQKCMGHAEQISAAKRRPRRDNGSRNKWKKQGRRKESKTNYQYFQHFTGDGKVAGMGQWSIPMGTSSNVLLH